MIDTQDTDTQVIMLANKSISLINACISPLERGMVTQKCYVALVQSPSDFVAVIHIWTT